MVDLSFRLSDPPLADSAVLLVIRHGKVVLDSMDLRRGSFRPDVGPTVKVGIRVVNGTDRWLSGFTARITILAGHQPVFETEKSVFDRILPPHDTLFAPGNVVNLPFDISRVDEVRVKVVQVTPLNKRKKPARERFGTM
jgi:hypothetical protein